MNTELQNKAWSVLPKEFKEEVKEEYFACKHCSAEASAMELEIIFGEHNLTSDAEGEEMLTVSRKEVQEMYSAFEEFKDKDNTCFNLETLFGSKCLWDETCNVASKESNPAEEDDVFNDPEPKCLYFKDGKCAHPAVAHLENGKLAKGADCDVSSCEDVEYEPKPAEPKFKEGDRAIIKARVVNVRQRSGSTLFNTLFNYDIRLDDGRTANWVDEQWLLPDNDDQVRAVTEKASERFDKILAKDLRKEKRLRIATHLMAAMMSNPVMFNKSIPVEYEDIVHGSLEYADALIEAARKETTMTKYYFMSYMFDAADGKHMASCTCKAENPTLKGLRNLIAKHNDADAETVVIISIKDLTKKEYEMLNNDNDD